MSRFLFCVIVTASALFAFPQPIAAKESNASQIPVATSNQEHPSIAVAKPATSHRARRRSNRWHKHSRAWHHRHHGRRARRHHRYSNQQMERTEPSTSLIGQLRQQVVALQAEVRQLKAVAAVKPTDKQPTKVQLGQTEISSLKQALKVQGQRHQKEIEQLHRQVQLAQQVAEGQAQEITRLKRSLRQITSRSIARKGSSLSNIELAPPKVQLQTSLPMEEESPDSHISSPSSSASADEIPDEPWRRAGWVLVAVLVIAIFCSLRWSLRDSTPQGEYHYHPRSPDPQIAHVVPKRPAVASSNGTGRHPEKTAEKAPSGGL